MRDIFVDHTDLLPGVWTVDFPALQEKLKEASLLEWRLPPVKHTYVSHMLNRSVATDLDFRALRNIARGLAEKSDIWYDHDTRVAKTLEWVDTQETIHLKAHTDQNTYRLEQTDGS